MKIQIQCNVCEAAEAKVMCCADNAALCCQCDVNIHAANKLASKHHRLPLSSSSSSSSSMPNCDICQEMVGYLFCVEDRALLCAKCDVAIHTINSYVSSHQRFLLTGVKVGFEETEQCTSLSTKGKSSSAEKTVPELASSGSIRRSVIDDFSSGESRETKDTNCMQNDGIGTLVCDNVPFHRSSSTSASSIPGRNSDEYLGLTDPTQNYRGFDTMSSKFYGSYCM